MNTLPPYDAGGSDQLAPRPEAIPGLQVSVRPVKVPPQLEKTQKQALRGFVRQIIDMVLGRGSDAADRLAESGIRIVEGEAEVRHADAEQKQAAAAKLFAESEAVKAEAALKLAEAQNKMAEAREKNARAASAEYELELRKRQDAAQESLQIAIEAIRLKGGDVEFDVEELHRVLILLEGKKPPQLPEPPDSGADKAGKE